MSKKQWVLEFKFERDQDWSRYGSFFGNYQRMFTLTEAVKVLKQEPRAKNEDHWRLVNLTTGEIIPGELFEND